MMLYLIRSHRTWAITVSVTCVISGTLACLMPASEPFCPLLMRCPGSALPLSHAPGRCLLRTQDETESEVCIDLTHQVFKPEDHPVGLMTFLENKRSEYYWAEFIRHLFSPPFSVSAVPKRAGSQPAKPEPSKAEAQMQHSKSLCLQTPHPLPTDLLSCRPRAREFPSPPGSWENVSKGCLC